MPIRPLPPVLVNQIAAGEVIERPASVVKELVENAIDAGATRIDVAIEAGGTQRIRVSDDGAGIPFDELALAVAAHATSKICEVADLDAIATLGFRGEALASVGSVSHLELRSRPADQAEAGTLEVAGGEVSPPRPAAAPFGTTVDVRNLFFNIPARRKFLRTEATESARVADMVESLALAHPEIGFRLSSERRTSVEVPPGQARSQRVLALLGPELAGELLEFETAGEGVRMWGMAGGPALARGTARHVRLYVNGRKVADRSLHHAVKEAYRGLIEPDRHPTVVVFLVVDPAEVDVNVHPTKSEVRFRHRSAIHQAVLHAVRARLREADLTPALELDAGRLDVPAASPEIFGVGPAADQRRQAAGAFVDSFRHLDARQKGFVYSEVKAALARELPELLDAPAPAPAGAEEPPALPTVRVAQDVLQVHASYIVAPDEEGLVIIDQHALHERVMFEKLTRRIGRGTLESQRLLMPAVVEVESETQVARLHELASLLERLGIEAEAMGPRSIAVHAFTSLLFDRGVDPVDFMTDLLGRAGTLRVNDEPEAALHEVLDMMACKAAVKAGDPLTPEELTELLAYRDTVARSSNCPHGRPTTLRLSLKELEKQFGRR